MENTVEYCFGIQSICKVASSYSVYSTHTTLSNEHRENRGEGAHGGKRLGK